MINIKGLFLFVGVSLVGLVFLQVYFLIRDYEAKKVDFNKEINNSFHTAMLEADSARIGVVADLLKADFLNPDLIILDSGFTDDGSPMLSFIDPQTNNRLLSFHIDREKGNEGFKYFDFLMEKTTQNLLIGTIYYYQDTLAELQKMYLNTTPIDTIYLRERFTKGLQNKRIDLSPKIHVEKMDPVQEESNILYTETISRKSQNKEETFFFASMGNPLIAILRRSLYLSSISLFIIMATLVSFYLLVRIIRNQKRLAQMKDDFIDNITHELLTPVTTLQMSLESIQRLQAKGLPVDDKYLGIAKGEVKRIDALIKKTLSATQSYKSATDLRKDRFYPMEVLEQVKSYYDKKYEDKISLTFSGNLDEPVNFDAHHFSKILHNLLDNSVKYCRQEQAIIHIDVKCDPKYFVLEIGDNGIGIPRHHHEKVFDKFHRVSQHDIHDVKGLGLGLYYIKSVLEQVKGEIRVLRSSNEGTVFTISIPNHS